MAQAGKNAHRHYLETGLCDSYDTTGIVDGELDGVPVALFEDTIIKKQPDGIFLVCLFHKYLLLVGKPIQKMGLRSFRNPKHTEGFAASLAVFRKNFALLPALYQSEKAACRLGLRSHP